jgi:hypothetical protein
VGLLRRHADRPVSHPQRCKNGYEPGNEGDSTRSRQAVDGLIAAALFLAGVVYSIRNREEEPPNSATTAGGTWIEPFREVRRVSRSEPKWRPTLAVIACWQTGRPASGRFRCRTEGRPVLAAPR